MSSPPTPANDLVVTSFGLVAVLLLALLLLVLTRLFRLKAGVLCVLMPGCSRHQRTPRREFGRVWASRPNGRDAGLPRALARCVLPFSEPRTVAVCVSSREGARREANARADDNWSVARRDETLPSRVYH
jgi:hypothetical protein